MEAAYFIDPGPLKLKRFLHFTTLFNKGNLKAATKIIANKKGLPSVIYIALTARCVPAQSETAV